MTPENKSGDVRSIARRSTLHCVNRVREQQMVHAFLSGARRRPAPFPQEIAQ